MWEVPRYLEVNEFPNNHRSMRTSQGVLENTFELNEGKIIAYQSLWGAAKMLLTGQLIALNTSIGKKEGLKSIT